MDPYDMLEAVDITGQIPANFYSQLESKKWSDRKEALEIVEKATSKPKIQPTDFSELVRVLKKTVSKDTNIVVVTVAAKCLCQLAQGLQTNFSPYANSCLTTLFEKFKEKKPNVVSVIRDATDACFTGTNIENIFEDVILFLDNKNPQIKSEMSLFLVRVFSRYPAQVMNKKTLRPLTNSLVKTLSDMDATVRDNSAMALGTAMKVAGETLLMPLIGDIEPIKVTKIKESCEKAEIITPQVNGQDHTAAPNLTNGQANVQSAQTNGVAATDDDDDNDEEDRIYDMLDAVDISPQINSSFYTQMESKKWSDRKEALEVVEKATSVPKIQPTDFNELVRVLKKAVAKDTNIVVATSAAKCLSQLAHGLRTNFSPHANSCITTLFEKFKEKKPNVVSIIRDATDNCFIGTNLEAIFEDVILLLDNKNPQIKSEMSLFLARVFSKYPAQVLNKKTLRPLINSLKKTLSDMDATVRENSAMAIGTAMKVTGEKLMNTLIADVEPIKVPKIKEFCEKAQVKKVPQAAFNSMNTAPAPPPPVVSTNHSAPMSGKPSSATMIRSTSSKRLASKVGPTRQTAPATGPAAAPAGQSATIKRTATIIKRSTVPKRASGSFQPPSSTQQQQQVHHHPPPPPVTANVSVPTFTSNNTGSAHEFAVPAQPAPIATPTKPTFTPIVKMPTKQGSLDMTIFRLISDDHDEVIASLSELEDSLTDEMESIYKSRINQIIDLACLQLVKSFYNQRTSGTGDTYALKITKSSDFLMKVFARRQLVSEASQQPIRHLLVQIFTITQFSTKDDDDIIRKKLNHLASAIMDSYEPANMMCILTGILNEPSPISIVEPVKNAIIRSMRSIK